MGVFHTDLTLVPSLSELPPLWNIAVLLLVGVLAYAICQSATRGHLPPGPPGLPLLGNVHQLDKQQWISFQKWKKQYGDIFSLNLLGQQVVVLNTLKVATELLDHRSNTYSGRPRWIMGNEILTNGMFFAVMPEAGHRWKRFRRAAHEGFGTNAFRSYQPLQEKQSLHLISQMLQDPADWVNHYSRAVTSAMFSVIYGWNPRDANIDHYAKRVHEYISRLEVAGTPGSYLVEAFPWMLHLPSWIAKWKREGLECYRRDTELFQGILDEVEAKMQEGKAEPCFATLLFEDEGKYELSRLETAWLAGSMFGIGIDTTATSLHYFTQAMLLYPEAMYRAQAELDTVVGRDRLPTFADRSRLPYVNALATEVLRWRPVGPSGFAKVATEDDWYNGYLIPKGTIVLPNIWSMNKDPEMYPDPDGFRPERYLDSQGNTAEPLSDTHGEGHLTFGFGRRICAAKELAGQTLFLDIAVLLWAFTFEKPCDKEGIPVTPHEDDFTMNGLILRPAPFECMIKPRFSDMSLVLEQTMSA